MGEKQLENVRQKRRQNVDLWNALRFELKKHKPTFIKVKGHADNLYNNRCDELAKKAISDAGVK